MKKLALPIIICCLVLNVNAQNVGPGTTTPNASAVLKLRLEKLEAILLGKQQ